MTGIRDYNYPAFYEAEEKLLSAGYRTINPASLDHKDEKRNTWRHCIKRDIPQMLTCDLICLLPGWQKSRGASLEYRVASAVGIKILKLPRRTDA